jgi:hypothetical protein
MRRVMTFSSIQAVLGVALGLFFAAEPAFWILIFARIPALL